ncbi:MAG TPA: uracil-DNA glycosylase [Rhizomicrobium sp.]|nr:uracil-DNA glycosylase [Rhizomicrobium sp.]
MAYVASAALACRAAAVYNARMQDKDPLATLAWLVEAGADEAIGEAPVNRLAEKVPAAPVASVAQFTPPPPRPQAVAAPSVKPAASGADPIGDAMAAAAAAKTLEQLKAAMEAFEGSALKRAATNTVFADGTPLGRVMFIGEAPGRDEDRLGKPFVGRAGQLLDKMLASIGLDRARNCYITNVINWRPPENRDPSPGEAAICLPFLRRHIELANPRLIVVLGAVAARHVMGITEGIMKTRGRWLEYRVGDAMVPVMPTLHPAYLLRQPAHKKLAWRDLQAVATKMDVLRLPEPAGKGS